MQINARDITICVACLNDDIKSFEINDGEFSFVNYLIVHQVSNNNNYDDVYDLIQKSHNVKVIRTQRLGLSLSRNISIESAKTKYIVFSDSDNSYTPNALSTINQVAANLKSFTMLSFTIHDTEGREFKSYSKKSYVQNKKTILRLSSIEHIVDRDFLIEHDIRFNERFGLGAIYPSCEQPIFANEIMKNNGTLLFYPEKFAIHPLENSGDDFFTYKNAATRKAMLVELYGHLMGRLMAFAFFLKKVVAVPREYKMTFLKGLLFS